MMKVGLQAFTLHEMPLTAEQMVEFAAKNGFDGIHLGFVDSITPTYNGDEAKALADRAADMGLFTNANVWPPVPVRAGKTYGELKQQLEKEIRVCAKAGWLDPRCGFHFDNEKFTDNPIPWEEQMSIGMRMLKELKPLLLDCGMHLNIENHGEPSFDVLRVVHEVGDDVIGVCFDTANALVAAEDPVETAKRVAPYTRVTHIKDGRLSLCDQGVMRQGRGPGQGQVDFETILPMLAEYHPDLQRSIEDHKWLFVAKIFQPEWLARIPQLSALELASFVQMAWQGQKDIDEGRVPTVEEYEAIPYAEQFEERVFGGRDYLKGLLKKLHL